MNCPCLHAILVVMTFVVSGCASFSTPIGRAQQIANYRKYPVGRILYSDASDTAKLQQLRPYVQVGARPSRELAAAAGDSGNISVSGRGETMFWWSGLRLRVNPGGVVYGIGYTVPHVGFGHDTTHWLVGETAIR